MKPMMLSVCSAALAAVMLCSCAPFQVATKVLDDSNLKGAAEAVGEELAGEAASVQAASSVLKENMIRQTYTTRENITKIEISDLDAAIEIKTADTDEIQVVYKEPADQSLYSFEIKGSTLEIRKTGRIVSNGGPTPTTVITLPAKEYQSIDVEANNLSLVTTDLDARQLDFEGSNASFQITGGNVNDLSISADNAAVTLSETTAKKIDVEADNGDVHFDQTQADAYECELDNGSIHGVLLGRQDEYNIRVTAEDKNTNLKTNGNTGAAKSIRFEVNNGNIEVRLVG